MSHEFSEAGPGEQRPDVSLRSVYDTADVCTQAELGSTSMQLSLSSSSAEDSGEEVVARLFGVAADGRRLFDENGAEGLTVTFDGTTPVLTPSPIAKLDRIILPPTKGFVTLKNTDDTVLSVYEPREAT